MSDYQQLESELERVRAEKQLQTVFWANMGHDIKTPISAIVGFARLMAESNDEDEKKEYLEIIEENNELLLRIISDVMDFSQLENHTLQIKKDKFSVNAVIDENFLSAKVRNKNDLLQIVADTSVSQGDLLLYSDRIRISQILANFVNNAMKYSVEGAIHIGWEKTDDGKSVHFYVSDSGKGIPEERIKDVFKRYVRLEDGGSGFGLGLSICKQLADLLDGEVGASSKVGIGSTFWLDIPYVAPSPDAPMTDSENPEVKQTGDEPGFPLLLIAEDDASNFRLEEMLLKKDFRIIHAWDGSEAVELYKEQHPALILMDINMPIMNGYQSFEKIRNLDVDIPVIAVTAYAMANEEEQIMAAGFNGYLSKPINITTFKNTVLKYLKRNV